MFHTIVSIKNDGHYFCRAGGNRPDGLNEPVTEKQMKPNTTLSEMLFKKAGKVTLRQNLDIKNLNKFLRKLH
ncbi:hypothetical protein DPI95_25865 [Salmonella enterica subsp. enterica serovar Kentucky]|nr:hypothetical protein [Salmonella enterica subsp. enterica serovar Kentucky]